MYLRPRSKVFKNRTKLARLLRLARSGRYSAPRLAEMFSCNKKTIFRALEDNRIVLPNLGYFPKRNFCDENFFNKLNPISSYWLGFIAADGCLTSKDKGVTIGLASRDKNHLRKFKTAIKTNAKISYVPSVNGIRLSIYSKQIFERLQKLGISPNKSLTIETIFVPNSLKSHFIRGVFDGDGWVGGNRVTHIQFGIAGNKPFLEKIQNDLIKNCLVNKVEIYPLSGKNRAYKLQYTGFQIFRILEYLYRNSTSETRLARKYKKYRVLKKKFYKN